MSPISQETPQVYHSTPWRGTNPAHDHSQLTCYKCNTTTNVLTGWKRRKLRTAVDTARQYNVPVLFDLREDKDDNRGLSLAECLSCRRRRYFYNFAAFLFGVALSVFVVLLFSRVISW